MTALLEYLGVLLGAWEAKQLHTRTDW